MCCFRPSKVLTVVMSIPKKNRVPLLLLGGSGRRCPDSPEAGVRDGKIAFPDSRNSAEPFAPGGCFCSLSAPSDGFLLHCYVLSCVGNLGKVAGLMAYPINVIDLFAGPGGLGEGFAGYRDSKGCYPFKVVVSAEMDASAHGTLSLRALQREVNRNPNTQRLAKLASLREKLTTTGSVDVGSLATNLGLEKAWAKVSSEALNLQLGVRKDDDRPSYSK